MKAQPMVILFVAITVACRSNAPIVESQDSEPYKLNYERAIMLDAEDLAEGGISVEYAKLKPEIARISGRPADPIEEQLDRNKPSYAVVFRGKTFKIFERDIPENESWGRASAALFEIVNAQLSRSETRFFALNSGNDLMGIFLRPEEARRAQSALPKRTDWPYLPNATPPDFGQYR